MVTWKVRTCIARVYLGYIARAYVRSPGRGELGPMPTRVVRMVAELSLGVVLQVAGDRERVGPCSVSSWMLNQGLGFGAGSIIQHHCEVLAIWLRTRLS